MVGAVLHAVEEIDSAVLDLDILAAVAVADYKCIDHELTAASGADTSVGFDNLSRGSVAPDDLADFENTGSVGAVAVAYLEPVAFDFEWTGVVKPIAVWNPE